MIDWNDNVKAALQAFEDYLRENGVDGFDNGYFLQSFYSEFDPGYDKPTQKTVADAVEQEGEKWTHFVDDDEGQLTKCRKHLKLCNGRDWVYVCEKGEYFVPSKMGYCGVKPIKPTISKAEAWDKVVGGFFSADGLLRHYIVKD